MEAGGEIIGVEEKLIAKKKRPGRKREPGFKITRFDKDLAALVKNGVTDVPTIIDKMAVDAENFNERVALLVKKGYFVFDAATRSTLHLGWEGYNLFAPKLRVKSALPKPLVEEKKEKPEGKEERQFMAPSSDTPVQILPAPQTTTDLAELLEKGSPKNGFPSPKSSLFVERQKRSSTQEKPVEPPKEQHAAPKTDTGKALILGGVEACELCKAKFKLNVKNTEEAKYGHCFCGAGFHKDCYESLLENGGNCVRCGRKLKLMFDKKAEDAVKGLKNVFE